MDKYNRLASNTILFGVSMFSGKIINLVLTRYFTAVLGRDSFGITGRIIDVVNVIIPLVSLGVIDAVSRFSLDQKLEKRDVYSSAMLTFFAGFVVFAMCYPLVSYFDLFKGYDVIVYIYIFTSILRVFTAQFVRGSMHTKLYAVDGILASATNLGFNILFLSGFKMGVEGFLWATIASDVVSFLFLSFSVKIWNFIKVAPVKIKLIISMLKYSAPLIPTNMSWWLVSASASSAVEKYAGGGVLSEYLLAVRVANLISVFVNIFSTSWQMSTVVDGQGEDQTRFFSKVFSVLSTVAFFAGSLVILFGQVITYIFDGSKELYMVAWQYLPLLVMGAVFNCFSSFYNSVFLMKKKTIPSLVTIMAAAGVSVVANILLVPRFQAYGAALAVMLSWMVAFLSRYIGARKHIKIDINWFSFFASFLLLLAQMFLAVGNVPYWQVANTGLVLLLFAINFKTVKELVIFVYNATIKKFLAR